MIETQSLSQVTAVLHPPAQSLVRDWIDRGGAILHAGLRLSPDEMAARITMPPTFGERGLAQPVVNVLRMLRSALCGTQESLSPDMEGRPRVQATRGCGLWVTSSGSTGRPKPIFWSWKDVLSGWPTGGRERTASVLSYYHLPYFSGLQGVLHALLHGRELVLVERRAVPATIMAATDPSAALHVLGTPSQMRLALASGWQWPRERVRLVAMGGEPAGQALLDGLALESPRAKITHTYATSEFGSLFCVADGRAGFPADILGRRLRCGKMIGIRQGVLTITDAAGLHTTSDRVERLGDRIVFAGRADKCTNVAGQAVDLSSVERALCVERQVTRVCAEARESAVTGTIVLLHVEAVSCCDRIALEARLRERAEADLPNVARPRKYVFHDVMPLAPSGKSGSVEFRSWR